MLKILLFSVICFFSVYGIIQFILNCIGSNNQKLFQDMGQPYAVLTVKNQEDCIESIIRSIAWQMLSQGSGINYISELIVVDLGSEDETLQILTKLANEYDFIYIMTKNQYLEFANKL